MARFIIIGGGLAGLLTARRLHDLGHEVLVVERLERPGGVWILNAAELVNKYASDVNITYGATAVEARERCVFTDRGRFCGDYVIDASGFREATAFELGIWGDRPAGVYTLWTVMRMLELGMLPGRRVLIYGCNNWASGLANWLASRGVEVRVVGPEYWCSERDRVIRVRGRFRVEQVLLEREGWVRYDTLVIAVPRPYKWFETEFVVGNAALPIDDVDVLRVAVDSFVKSLFAERRFRVLGGEVFPRETSDLVVVKVEAPGLVSCGKSRIQATSRYVVLKIDGDCNIEYVRSY